MKKIKYILLLIVCCFVFTGCGSSNLKDLSYSKLQSMIKNKETFFFIVVKDGCRYCEAFIPKAEEVLNEQDVVGYKLNISDMSDDEYNEFDSLYNVEGTPTTIFMNKGEEVLMQRFEGNVSKDKLIEKLKQNNYIK